MKIHMINCVSQMADVKDGVSIAWKSIDGRITLATASRCDCGLLCYVNGVTVKKTSDGSFEKALTNCVEIPELEGEFDEETGDFICPHK